ncbi:MAG: transglutaminase domain-containing protein [Candidatus Bruticola sp.]
MNRLTLTAAVSLLFLAPLSAAYAQEPQVHGKLYNSYTRAVAQANPWDKYQAEPAGSGSKSAPDNLPNKAANQTPSSNSSTGSLANPWDKYQAEPAGRHLPAAKSSSPSKAASMPVPATAEGAPQIEDGLPAATGANPWDKYTPAPTASKAKKKNVAKVKERPEKLELAEPLPIGEIPQGTPVLKNNLAVGIDNYFAIEYSDQLVGYSHYKINRLLTLGGQSTYVMDSASRIKMGVDSVQDLKFTANTQIDKKTLAPALFLCVQGEAKSQEALSVNCIYSEDFIAQNNNYMGKEQGYLQKYADGKPPLLVFNNLWGHLDTFPEHYWLMVRAASQGGVLETYDPILQGIGKTIVYKPIKETWKDRNGQAHTTFVYKITDAFSAPLAYVRVYAKNYELAEIREIGSGLVFRRSTPGVVAAVEKSPGQRIKANAEISNVYFQDPDKLTYLEAFVDLRLRGGELAQHQVRGYKQKFYGEVKEGKIRGRAVVQSEIENNEPEAKFPFNVDVPPELEKYLQACPGIELEVTSLTTKAKEITWKSESAFQAAQRLNGYVSNQIGEGVALPSARQTLENQIGNPEGKALLLTAMLRALKIPARMVGGLSYNNGSFTAHRWVEAWLGPKDGWIPFDPSTNESGFINASHITLWESGDLQAMDVYVEKFSPRPARTTSYFKTPLKWPIGEKRTYFIYHQGKLIGLESSHMYDMEVNEGGETYNFKSESVIIREDAPLIFESTLNLNQNGLPVSFSSSEDNGQRVHHEAFSFQGTNIVQNLSLKDSPSLPRPAKSKMRLEREKQEAEQATSARQAEEVMENNPPAPETIQVDNSSDSEVVQSSTTSAAVTNSAVQTQDNNTEKLAEAASADSSKPTDPTEQKNSQSSSDKPTDNEVNSSETEQLGQSLGEAAQNSQQDITGSDDSPEPAVSDEAKAAAEAEAQKQADLKARQAAKEKLIEVKACYDEAKQTEAAKQQDNSTQESSPSSLPDEDAEITTRRIPYSVGTYLVDPRFLSQWALVVEQSPAVASETSSEASNDASASPSMPNVDPNVGVVSSSEVIVPQSSSNTSTNQSSEAGTAVGETGADTFSQPNQNEDENDETYSFKAFIPSSLKVQDLTLQRADADETIVMPDGTEIEAARLDTEKGMLFFMDLKTGKVVKISIPSQNLEMYLEDTHFEL